MKTTLKDRVLWYDGTNEVDSSLVPVLLMAGVPVDKIISSGPDVDQFNQLSMDETIRPVKEDIDDPSFKWKVPEEYVKLDLRAYVHKQVDEFLEKNPKASKMDYKFRVDAELDETERRDMAMMMKTIIYVVDTLKKNNQVWGVGRGSSCASLILFLIGLHKVDPVKYAIPMAEFYHD
jgi:DNA polymerase III alpha subunit